MTIRVPVVPGTSLRHPDNVVLRLKTAAQRRAMSVLTAGCVMDPALPDVGHAASLRHILDLIYAELSNISH